MEYSVLTPGMGLLHEAPNYIRWVYESIAPYLGKRIVEIGSGLGYYSRFFRNLELYCATEVYEEYLAILRKKLTGLSNVSVHKFDVITDDPHKLAVLAIDTVVCTEVLEHIEKDEVAIEHMRAILTSGGRLVIVTPALPFIYGSNDRSIGHERRYSRKELLRKLHKAHLSVERMFYHNVVGIPAWFFNGRILRRKVATAAQLRMFDKLVPFLRVFERYAPPCVGLNLIAVAKKT